jgi:hypothetical protein
MFGAPQIEYILRHPLREDSAACCIVLAPPFTRVGKDEVIPRISYLDSRSAHYIHFYCAGYSGFWDGYCPLDIQEIGEVKQENGKMIAWAFSQTLFAEFVSQLERLTTWKYTGKAELILLNPRVDFSNALVLDVDKMILDASVQHSSELFESIIRYCREHGDNPSAYDFSNIQLIREAGKTSLESLLALLPKPVQGLWNRGHHYAVKNIEKAELKNSIRSFQTT